MFTNGFKFSCLLIFIIGLSACTKDPLPAPSCRVNANYISSHKGPGACIIRLNNKMLALQMNNTLYDLPISKDISHQSAQCSAHHEMWLQTGLNIEVEDVVGIQTNGTWLFGCKLDAGFDGSEAPFSAPVWSNNNIQHIAFVDPFTLDLHDWQQPDHFIVVRDAFVAQGNYQKAQLNSNISE